MSDAAVAGLERTVTRVTSKKRLGPDAQVDDKAMVIVPEDPSRTDPFLALAEDWFSEPGFEWHPHRGLETVTTVVGGVLEHGDNIGNAGALHQDDVQWMTAGRGIIHRELAYRNEHVHTLQLWLNLPARSKLVATRYQDLIASDRPRLTSPGAVLDVISGSIGGVTGPAVNHWPVQAAIVSLEPGASLTYSLPAGHRAFGYVLSGTVSIGGKLVRAGQTAWSDPIRARQSTKGEGTKGDSTKGEGTKGDSTKGDSTKGDSTKRASALLVSAPDRGEPARVMIYSGEPIGEPVAMGGPFVMNSRTEITKAFADFHAGKFGPVPRQARLRYDR